jgi:hypothetical protein
MINNNSVTIGQHCWALSLGKLLIVLKTSKTGYECCGPWECGIHSKELKIISIIDRPEGYENTELYYSTDDDL